MKFYDPTISQHVNIDMSTVTKFIFYPPTRPQEPRYGIRGFVGYREIVNFVEQGYWDELKVPLETKAGEA